MNQVLVDNRTGNIIYKYNPVTKEIKIPSSFIADLMKKQGIVVPLNRREEFGNKRVIKMDDELFHKAFKEIYLPAVNRNSPTPQFTWKVTKETQ